MWNAPATLSGISRARVGGFAAKAANRVSVLARLVEIEIGSGDTRLLGPGSILLAEDTTGQGHINRPPIAQFLKWVLRFSYTG